jgi:hypothetical protein
MTDHGHERDLKPVAGAVYGLAGAGAVALIVGLAAFAAPQPADALPSYAQQTGKSCGGCHVNAAGGGPRNAFGNAFAANGHKLPSAAKPNKASVDGGTSSATPAATASTIVWDNARAEALSLDRPYYSHFLYNSCDYRNCAGEQGK